VAQVVECKCKALSQTWVLPKQINKQTKNLFF
jgi:hypothetical protein